MKEAGKKSERKMLNDSKQLLFSEITLASGYDKNQIEDLIKDHF